MSLARMNRVLAHDEALATLRIEPGLTFQELARHLGARGSQLLPPTTGSGPHTSILGNVLERGIGKGLYEDMAAHACGFEVVLPNGTLVNTGPIAPAAVAGATPVASGPGLRDLFIQANLGVVTAADLWLHPAPRLQQLVWALLPDAALGACIDRLRPLLLRGDPWLRAELVSRQRALSQGAAMDAEGWIAVIRCWGDGAEDLGLRRRTGMAALAEAGGLDVGAGAEEDGAAFDMDGSGLLGAYAAKPGGMPADPDPDRDRCGVLWVAPCLPMRGEVVAAAIRDMTGILAGHGFGPCISLRRATGRTLLAVVGLFYDRDEPGGDARAARCATAMQRWMRDSGLAPYRLGIADMADALAHEEPGRRDLLAAIKRAADPAGILSPGRHIASGNEHG